MSTTALSPSPSPAASPHAAFHVASLSPHAPFAPTRRPPAASRASPRRALYATATSSSTQHPKQRFAEGGVAAGAFAGYVDAATQYSPDGFPPTAGRDLAAHAGKPPGSAIVAASAGSSSSSAKKRKDTAPAESDSGPMSGTGAAPGAPQRVSQQQPDEPQLRSDPVRAPSSAASASTSGTYPASSETDSEPREARSTHGLSAAPKRSRPEGTLKVMPLQYETCSPKDLGVLVANMLMELIRINDRIPLRDGRLTRFHSRAPPGISVSDYLQRLIQHATLSPPILLSMVYYIDRLCTLYPAFTINGLTVHRFLITAATVAAKGLSDSFWTNPTYARIGGIPVSELASLELELLQRVQWKIVPKPEALEDYYASLVERTDGYAMEVSQSASSTSVGSTSSADSDNVPDHGNASIRKDEDDKMEDRDT